MQTQPELRVQVDPFDAQEAKPYKNDPQVLAMTNLVAAYQSNDIASFEKILATNKYAMAFPLWRGTQHHSVAFRHLAGISALQCQDLHTVSLVYGAWPLT